MGSKNNSGESNSRVEQHPNGDKQQPSHTEPFRNVDTTDVDEVIDTITAINQGAGYTLQTALDEKEKLTEKISRLERRLEKVESDFKDYRERVERDSEGVETLILKDVLSQFLPIRDDLARALAVESEQDITEGVELILKRFDSLLNQRDVGIIRPNHGEKPNPKVHRVMTKVEDEHVEEGHIVECFQPGYRIEDEVIRPARVSVSG